MKKIPFMLDCMHPDDLFEEPEIDQVFFCHACAKKFATVEKCPNFCPNCGEKFAWKDKTEVSD